ncbi:hypothetical protein JQC92_02290 [Shewanella sp. 202IG2-18]|uniref:hypothetical protein n=1 Tax=Parashewanella hymeniacidonis TaxID=2807618 RepID=UPI00196161A1|nr:hypothetical protein [Parashewanella hymeniacidonis]MBM7070870.1 hypothetical protein [Parashewanella hymeniacidonis]
MKKSVLTLSNWLEHRERLKPKIQAIGRMSAEPDLFETINKACSDERAFLFLAPDGFIVLRPRHCRQQTFISVPVAYCEGGKALERYQGEVINLSRMGKAEFVQFYTARKGFDRLALKLGWSKFGCHRNLAIWRYQLN